METITQPLSLADLRALMQLQEEVLDGLKAHGDWLRRNTRSTMRGCLTNDHALGVKRDGSLVAAAILQNVDETTNLTKYVPGMVTEAGDTLNLKAVFTSASCRQTGIAQQLLTELTAVAQLHNKKELLCTIHPDNVASQRLFQKAGYEHVGDAVTSYGARRIYALKL